MPGATRYDAAVIGAGHNGLTAACLLAKKGKRVVVLERRDVIGGLCAGEEFHPGYRHAGLLHDTSGVRPGVVEALSLREHGLELGPMPPVYVPAANGDGLLLAHDPEEAAAEIARFSERDAERYREFHAFVNRIRTVIEPLLNEVPPDLLSSRRPAVSTLLKLGTRGLAMRRLGKRDMMELLRVPPMCVADWLNEWFETDALKVALSTRAIAGTWCGPWSPGTAANLLLWMCTANRAVAGGPAALVSSLERSARHYGVDVRTGAAVERIAVSNGAATGVALQGSETLEAGAVLSSCDPHTTFLDLLRPGDIPDAATRRVEQYRMRGTTAKVHLAIDGPLSNERAIEYACTGENLDFQERAFDAVKYRAFSDRPLLDILVASATRSDRAPSGHAAVSILVHFAPHRLDGGWTHDARERLGDAVVAELDRHFPGAAKRVVAREILTPADIEERYGLTGGHIHHGEHALDQLVVRPTIDAPRYATPVPGLYLCGSGAHPGGGVTCAPGWLAAGVVD